MHLGRIEFNIVLFTDWSFASGYNGIDLTLYPLQQAGGDDLIFLGRIHPDKGLHLAIEVARLSGMRLVIAGIIQDEAYFRERIKPHLDDFRSGSEETSMNRRPRPSSKSARQTAKLARGYLD